MKALVVHDRTDVLHDIVELLENEGVESAEIDRAEDAAEAHKLLVNTHYDLAIVDLTLSRVKGRSDPTYGVVDDLFQEMFVTDNLLVPGDIIGITKEKEALQAITTSIGPHLMAIIHQDGEGAWKAPLSDRIKYVKKSSLSRLVSISNRYDYDVAIITALDKERAPYLDILKGLRPVPTFPGVQEFEFTDRDDHVRRGVLYSVGSPGQSGCASATQAIIGRFRPKVCFLSGFCGGPSGAVDPGEVLLFKTVFDWDTGKWTEETSASKDAQSNDADSEPTSRKSPVFLPRVDPISTLGMKSHDIIRQVVEHGISEFAAVQKRIRELSNNKIDRLSFKSVSAASGSAVVASEIILSQIRQPSDKIAAVDMEAYGFYQACKFTPGAKPEMLCVKAAADFCNGQKDDTLHAACCYSSAKTVEDILKRRWPFG